MKLLKVFSSQNLSRSYEINKKYQPLAEVSFSSLNGEKILRLKYFSLVKKRYLKKLVVIN